MREKITHHHLTKPAYLYLRQSTMGQVRHHRESTERQYALKEKACHLGWSAEQGRILEGDWGISGAARTLREDFKTVVADVSMGQAKWARGLRWRLHDSRVPIPTGIACWNSVPSQVP